MPRANKPFRTETRMIDGEEVEVRVYESGAVMRTDRGQGALIQGPPSALIHTREQGLAMHARLREKRMQATREGIAEGLKIQLKGDASEWRMLTAILVEQFAKSKNLRGMGEVYLQLGRAAGYLSQKDEEPGQDTGALVGALVAFLKSKLPRSEVIDAEVSDDSTEPS